ncbi:MAG: hypothetical protein KIT84_24585 [Labilithrix sp.]|nr:hypothetical protein [Labilithrix sp.]MCW5814227.1 hypothetical protein [Labilithrix sp.]
MTHAGRYGRQVRLADVGAAGQARIEATRTGLATHGFARAIEERYLRAAGAQVEDAPAAAAIPDLGLRHDAARDVAAGAYAALLVLRRAVRDEG